MEIITGYRGTPHLTSEKERRLIRGIFGSDSVVLSSGNQLEAQVLNNSTIQIKDGDLIQKGALGGIPKGSTEDVTIESGSSGYNRIDLICCRYEKDADTRIESMSLVVKKGTQTSGNSPTVPSYTEGDISNGDLIDEFPLYQVRLTGYNITSVERAEGATPVLSLANAVYFTAQ